jgi:soluble lytic murein transglycosylase-like protein
MGPPAAPARSARRRLVGGLTLLLLALMTLEALDLAGVIDSPLPGGRETNRRHFLTDARAPLADFYTPEVRYWEREIVRWAREYGVNPNVIAIVMQIESCGDAAAMSQAGAVGLMQVMPFHFDYGENMLNPDTNVRRGVGVLLECLSVHARYDLGLAMACYNGGPSVTQRSSQEWAAETRYYYEWATGLWADVLAGRKSSATLAAWLDAGGRRLCEQAARSLGLAASGEASS